MQYRIKTEEEFLQDFGIGWENIVKYSWNKKGMAPYFGKELIDYNGFGNYTNSSMGPYTYSPDMITNKPLVNPNSNYKVITNGLFKV